MMKTLVAIMRPRPRLRPRPTAPACVAFLLCAWTVGGCSSADSAGGALESDGKKIVATISGEPITMAELQTELGSRLAELDFQHRNERYELMERALDGAVRRRLLEAEAASRGLSLQEFVAAETAAEIEVTDEEIEDFYRENAAALEGQTLEQITPRIRDYLENAQRERALRKLARELAANAEVVLLLDPVRAVFDNGDSPARGPSRAAITLVEFSDFECPFCGRFFTTLKELEENYGDRLRIVYRQFPLDNIHPHAVKAAEASLCAHEQGRFWEMHDLMFTEQDRLTILDLKEKAGRLGLDRAAFDACLESGRYLERIERDAEEGDAYGVSGTPAIFINGIHVPGGAVPYDVLAEYIEKELRRIERG